MVQGKPGVLLVATLVQIGWAASAVACKTASARSPVVVTIRRSVAAVRELLVICGARWYAARKPFTRLVGLSPKDRKVPPMKARSSVKVMTVGGKSGEGLQS